MHSSAGPLLGACNLKGTISQSSLIAGCAKVEGQNSYMTRVTVRVVEGGCGVLNYSL